LDLEDEEEESDVGYHSENIALAFGLIVGREIVVRDNNRFHCFKDN
jgi:hypothetical protein